MMDIATKLDLLTKEIAEASYYGGIESRVMGQWVDFKELCDEHKRLVQELTSAACAEWFRVEQKSSQLTAELSYVKGNQAFKEWIVANYNTVSEQNGELVWHDARVGAAIGHARAGWFAAFKFLKGD